MKTVFCNNEIPHLWAHKTQSHASGAGSISFRDETGYSYAMPICRHATAKDGTPCVLFTTESRSVTTSRHTAQFRSAIPYGVPVYHVHNVLANDKAAHAANIKERDEHIARLHGQATKARLGTLKAADLASNLRATINNRNDYAAAFGVRVKPLSVEDIASMCERWEKSAARARKAQLKAQKERAEREAAENAENIRAWLAGEAESFRGHYSLPVMLRANGEDMETSRGARVPLTHAKRAVLRVAKVRAAGQAWRRNGSTLPVGHYHIDSISETGDVVAGCHRIAWSEIERFAISQGWLTPATVNA